jgi:hypothetical protein
MPRCSVSIEGAMVRDGPGCLVRLGMMPSVEATLADALDTMYGGGSEVESG